MKNNFKFLFLAIIFFVAGFFLGQSMVPQNTETIVFDQEENEGISEVSMMIDNNTSNLLIYENVEISEGDTVFDVLQKLSEENDFTLDFDPPGEWGIFIKQIASKKNGEDNKYWQYFVNNEQPGVAANRYELKGGEVIMFKFAPSKF